MKLTINRNGLLAALAAVKPVAGRGTLPILSNLLLVGKGKDLTITATDLDVHLRVETEAAVSKDGKTTVRAGLLFDIIRMAMAMEAFLLARDCATKASRLRAAVAAPKSP